MDNTLMIGLTPPLEGGSEQHIYEISSRLKCKVLTQKGSICKDKIELPIRGSGKVRSFSFFVSVFFYSFYLMLFKNKYRTIHLHENLLYFLVPLLRIRYKVVVTVHGIRGFRFYDKPVFWMLFSRGLRFANVLIAVNLEDKKLLEKQFKKVIYVPNGVDLSAYEKINSKVENKIVFIGRIHEQKGIIYLLEAFEKVNKKFPKFKLELIGNINEYAKEFQRKFENKNIIWRGYIGDVNEKVKLLKSSYCIVLPSLWEGLPLTLFESLATSRPLVVSDIKAFKSVVKNEVVFFKVKDSNDLANKLTELIKNKKSADLIGKEGKKLSGEYDWNKIAKRTMEAYNK